MSLNGREFLYTPQSLGWSIEAIRKIDELVDGRERTRGGHRTRWRDLKILYRDLENEPRARTIFGAVVQLEIQDRLGVIEAAARRARDSSA